ncbi:MAG: transcriptional regulator [Bacilli bacterium]|nr:transcriptional regulator [Bacilli bacterium]
MNIFDIAHIAKVSRKTVQRVLNNTSNVHPDTRARILKIMEKNHYEPNSAARKLSSKKTNTLGLFVIQDVEKYSLYSDDLFFGAVIGATISQCAKRGFNTLVSILDISNIEHMLSLYKQKSIDGGIVISWSNIQWVVDKVIGAGFHIGVFDQNNITHPSKIVPVPILDNQKSAYLATQYLLELGHEDIAIITGDMKNASSVDRLQGFMNAIQEHGLVVPDSRVYYGNFTEEAGAAAVAKWMETASLPKAIFCSNDLMAYGVLKALVGYGISVPEQISVIGFDDLLISQYTHPPLTTMRFPRIEMAVSLANRLIDRLENEVDEVPDDYFQAELILRSSCKHSPKI